MEFQIPQKFTEDHFAIKDKLVTEFYRHRSSKIFFEDITKYFKSKNIEPVTGNNLEWEKSPHYECYHFAISYLGLKFPNNMRDGDSNIFTRYVNNAFDEVQSKNEIAQEDLVVYYFDKNKYLHAGVIEKIVNSVPLVISQWGSPWMFRHPIQKVDKSYGNKYKIFKINPLKNKNYLDSENNAYRISMEELHELHKDVFDNPALKEICSQHSSYD
jgi:hypothetical protein